MFDVSYSMKEKTHAQNLGQYLSEEQLRLFSRLVYGFMPQSYVDPSAKLEIVKHSFNYISKVIENGKTYSRRRHCPCFQVQDVLSSSRNFESGSIFSSSKDRVQNISTGNGDRETLSYNHYHVRRGILNVSHESTMPVIHPPDKGKDNGLTFHSYRVLLSPREERMLRDMIINFACKSRKREGKVHKVIRKKIRPNGILVPYISQMAYKMLRSHSHDPAYANSILSSLEIIISAAKESLECYAHQVISAACSVLFYPTTWTNKDLEWSIGTRRRAVSIIMEIIDMFSEDYPTLRTCMFDLLCSVLEDCGRIPECHVSCLLLLVGLGRDATFRATARFENAKQDEMHGTPQGFVLNYSKKISCLASEFLESKEKPTSKYLASQAKELKCLQENIFQK